MPFQTDSTLPHISLPTSGMRFTINSAVHTQKVDMAHRNAVAKLGSQVDGKSVLARLRAKKNPEIALKAQKVEEVKRFNNLVLPEYDLPEEGALLVTLKADFQQVPFETGVQLFETPPVRIDASGIVHRPAWAEHNVFKSPDVTHLAYEMVRQSEELRDKNAGGLYAFVKYEQGCVPEIQQQYVFGTQASDGLPLRLLHEIPSVKNPGQLATRIMLNLVEAGDFLFGAQKEKKNLPTYYTTMHPVTVEQFAAFVRESGYVTQATKDGAADWQDPRFERGHKQGPTHPVVYVNYFDAQAFAKWAALRVPSELEVEKAVRGTDGRPYPWGDAPPAENLLQWSGPDPQNRKVQKHGTSSVFDHPDGRSPYGVLDAAGNVWVWTSTPA